MSEKKKGSIIGLMPLIVFCGISSAEARGRKSELYR